MRDSHLHFRGMMLCFLRPYGRKREPFQALHPGPAQPPRGPHPTSASAGEILRGSLTERYLTCGKPGCKCARGERHGPVWYLSVSLDQTHRTGRTVPSHQVEQVRGWIENYHRVKERLEEDLRY